MQSDELLDLIGEIKEEHIQDAKAHKKRRFPTWAKWAAGAAAACLVLVVSMPIFMPRAGSSAPGSEAEAPTAGGGGGSGHEEGMAFMSYAGPVFPLTLMEETSGLIAERRITYDFSTYDDDDKETEVWGGNEDGAIVRDSYRVTNISDKGTDLTGVYPIAGDYQLREWPAISVNGQDVAYEIISGSYTGGFRGAGDEHTESVNLHSLTSWEGYRDLLTDGSYFAKAFTEAPVLDTPVILYELTDITDGDCGFDAATLAVHYRYDAERTNIMTYGFNGGGEDPETGEGIRDFFIREGRRKPDEETKYLIVVGDDIEDIRLQGYQNGACEPGNEAEGPGASLTRSETTMGEVLKTIAQSRYGEISGTQFDGDHNRYLNERISFEMYYEDIVKYFAEYGPMGTDPKERYSFEWGARLEDIVGETAHRDRILYLTFPITIPAGDSIELTAKQVQPASFDFHCGGENVGIEGYDMVTTLGSNLTFLSQKAAIENYGAIEIVRQNFGFDPANGVTEVELSVNDPQYYLEVRKITGTEGE